MRERWKLCAIVSESNSTIDRNPDSVCVFHTLNLPPPPCLCTGSEAGLSDRQELALFSCKQQPCSSSAYHKGEKKEEKKKHCTPTCKFYASASRSLFVFDSQRLELYKKDNTCSDKEDKKPLVRRRSKGTTRQPERRLKEDGRLVFFKERSASIYRTVLTLLSCYNARYLQESASQI